MEESTRTPPDGAPRRGEDWFRLALGVAMLLLVGGVYVRGLLRDHLPPGSPWSGIALGILGILMLWTRPSRARTVLRILGLVSVLLWLWSTAQGG